MNCISKHTQMTILYKPVKNPDADVFVRDARSRVIKLNFTPTDEKRSSSDFWQALKQGGTTVILPDHTLITVVK